MTRTVETLDKLSNIIDCSRQSVKDMIASGMPSKKIESKGWGVGYKRQFDMEEVASWILENKTSNHPSHKHFRRKAHSILRALHRK